MSETAENAEVMKSFLQKKETRDKEWSAMLAGYQAAGFPTVPLWEAGAPGFRPEYGQAQPSLILYPPHEGTPTGALIISAGGAFLYKYFGEAKPVADYFYKKGFYTAILDYRVLPYARLDAAADGLRAVQYLRCHARENNVDPGHIALMGFSAGGILSNVAGSIYKAGDPAAPDPLDRCSSRPDAVVVGYGSFSGILNVGVGLNFDIAAQREAARTSPELLLHPDCPPRFLFQTAEDDPRLISNMQLRLAEMGIPFEAHLFQSGEHGGGLYDGKDGAQDLPHTAHWAELAAEWLCHWGFPTAG